jgi:hypothetical protein
MNQPVTSVADKPCVYCGSLKAATILMPPGSTHHAKLACLDCGRMRRWLPRPRTFAPEPPDEVLALVRSRRLPCVLTGSPSQCRAARSIRQTLLFRADRADRPRLVALLKCVKSAGWFFANKDAPLERLRWPKPGQMEGPPTGDCANCGDPAHDGQGVCSEECADELAVRVP